MRILTIVGTLEKGGTERGAQNFAIGYRTDGHDSRVLATSAGGLRVAELERHGVRAWVGMDPATAEAISSWRPDVIHIHSHGPTADAISQILDLCSTAAVIETNVFSRPSPWVNAVDISFQLSQWCHWLYAQRAGQHAPSTVLAYPIDAAAFQRAAPEDCLAFRLKHGIAPGDILLGRIGQSHPSKWSELLVQTLERVRDCKVPAKLLVVNAPDGIISRCKASRYASDVRVIDQLNGDDQLSIAYSAIDIFVHAADVGESFGFVLAESLLCETPVVTLSTPWHDNSQGEVVGNNIGGVVTTSPKGFIAAVLDLVNAPDRRRELGRQGREHIASRFDPTLVVRQSLEHASHKPRASTHLAPKRSTILSLYRNSYERPRWLTLLFIGRLSRLALTRYTTGYAPWGEFVARSKGFLARRLFRVRGT